MTRPDLTPSSPPPKGSLWRTIKAVIWGFFGVRQHGEYQKDIQRLTPLHVVAVGFVAAVLLVIGLVAIAYWVSRK